MQKMAAVGSLQFIHLFLADFIGLNVHWLVTVVFFVL